VKSAIRGAKTEALKLERDAMTVINFGTDGKPRILVATITVDGKPHPIIDSRLFDTQTAAQLDHLIRTPLLSTAPRMER
jgi:hypothetical protein